MNRLDKPLTITYTPGKPGFPGYPGAPSQPGRTVKGRRRVCTYYPSGETPSPNTGIPSGGRRCYDVEETSYVPGYPGTPPTPGVPATPASIVYDYKLGWNARARSIAPIRTSGRFEFTIPASSTGVVCGMTFEPAATGFADIAFGFYVSHGVIRVYERGTEAQYIGYYPGAVLRITREGGKIKYAVNGTTVRTRDNESAPAFLGAALYSAGDIVDNASLTEFASGAGVATFPAMQAFGGTEPYASGRAEFPPMTTSGSQNRTGSGVATFRAMQAFGSDSAGYAIGGAEFQPMQVFAEAYGLTPTYALGDAIMIAPNAGGYGMTGEVGGGGATFEPLFAIGADRPYAYGSARFRPMTSYAETYLAEDELAIFSMGFAGLGLSPVVDLYAVMSSSMEIEGLIAVQTVLNASVTSEIEVSSEMSAAQLLGAMLSSLMSASTLSSGANGQAERTVWALNVEINGSTRYEGYDFNSFAKVGDSYYGCKSDGIYLLAGPDDAGESIESRVAFGNLSFGSIQRKALPYVYAGIASDGKLVLKVTADGHTHYYTARDSTEMLKAHRFELGRGLRASYYDIELMSDGGNAFDLSEIEFQPIQLKRSL